MCIYLALNTYMPDPKFERRDDPLAGVDTEQYTYSNFIYPMDLGAPGAGRDHYMVFHINETSMTNFQTRTVGGRRPTDNATITNNQKTDAGRGKTEAQIKADEAAKAKNDQQIADNVGKSGEASSATTYQALKKPISRVATTVVLYMPGDITCNYNTEWDTKELGVAKEIISNISGAGSSKTDIMESAGASGLHGFGQMLNQYTGLNLSDALSSQTRLVVNNHREVIFEGIGFRRFQFSFRFTPTTEAEAVNIDNIIRAFKFYGAPEVLTGTSGRFMIYPGEFDIQYYSNGKENLFLNKISTCALTDMSVNYTPLGHWSAHRPYKDGNFQGASSVCTDVVLQFTELEIMTKRRILEGY